MSISVHPDTPQAGAPIRTLAASPAAEAMPVAGHSGRTKIRSRLFTKYVALFVAVVGVALLSNGIFEVFFYYREHKAALIRIQHEQAEAAAAKIGQFIKEIESQLGWTTQLSWSAGSVEQRRFERCSIRLRGPASEILYVKRPHQSDSSNRGTGYPRRPIKLLPPPPDKTLRWNVSFPKKKLTTSFGIVATRRRTIRPSTLSLTTFVVRTGSPRINSAPSTYCTRISRVAWPLVFRRTCALMLL